MARRPLGPGTHHRGPLVSSVSSDSPFARLRSEASMGESEIVTTFDDFDTVVLSDTFGGTAFEASGWVLTDVGAPVADTVLQNSGTSGPQDSALRLNAGTAADTGGNMQLNSAASVFDFPHIKIPGTGVAATILDGTLYAFACRIGIMSNAATWDGKFYIGWGEETDTGILTAATGAITQAEGGPLVGFHCTEAGAITGISQRTVNTAYADGTNVTTLYAAGAANGTADLPEWYDLAVVMQIADMSDNANNGTTTFFHRRVPAWPAVLPPWIRHPTVLRNQTPNNDLNLTPMIELVNGPANQSDLLIDWWAFGASRYSRTGR